MAYTLQQLSDLEDIRTLKHRYFRAIDTADWGLLDGMFTDDVHVEYVGGTYHVSLDGAAKMAEFLANSFHTQCMAMHHGHMPEITLTGEDCAEGTWYLQDIFLDFSKDENTWGTALYRDEYQREGGVWKISSTVYDRVMEVIEPLNPAAKYTAHRLAQTGRKFEELKDISHLITWEET
jgi:hypothetical protein